MSPSLYGNIKMAVATLKASRLRSFLTMLGVIIGVTSVVTIVSIGEGVKNQIVQQIDQMGRDLITVRPGDLPQPDAGGMQTLAGIGAGNIGSLSPNDTEIVRKSEGVGQAVPLGLVGGEVKANDTSAGQPLVLASSNGLDKLLGEPVEYGEFFADGDALIDQPNVAVLGSKMSQRLFGERAPLGSSFEFLGQTFFVRGVLKKMDSSPLSMSTDFNDAIIIPYQTAQKLTNDNVPLYQILAKPTSPGDLDRAVGNITASLNAAHKDQQRFSVLKQDQSLAATNEILNLLTMMIAGIAAISLLVGGIGIMDVMLVSVAERTREVGLRKALGASNRQIMMQFLTESAVLSLTGGVIGVVISVLINFGLRAATSLAPAFPWWIFVLSVLVSLVVGIIFGTIPALKAARKDPIDALRNH